MGTDDDGEEGEVFVLVFDGTCVDVWLCVSYFGNCFCVFMTVFLSCFWCLLAKQIEIRMELVWQASFPHHLETSEFLKFILHTQVFWQCAILSSLG